MPNETSHRKFSTEARSRFAKAGTYREFLQMYFRDTNLSYAEVARRGGFSSRSYPRDVTEGRRRLTAKSLPCLLRGLRLETDLSRLLQALYFFEFPDEHPEALSQMVIQARLEKERQRVIRNCRGPFRKKAPMPVTKGLGEFDLACLAAGLADVIAALGDLENGATIDEIHKRTGFGRATIARQLELLVKEGIVTYSGDSRRYFPSMEHLDWTGQAGSRLAKAAFRSSIERLSEVALSHFTHPETTFVNSAVSISKQDLPRLREELRDVILKFVDRSIESGSTPDTVVQLVVGFFESRLAPPRAF